MSLTWIGIIILLIIVEIMTVNLTTIWYIASALVALVLSFFIDSFVIEFGVFVILGTILLFTTRPLLIKYLKPSDEKTNFDRIVGMNGIVTEKILKSRSGAVKVDGKVWTAIADSKIEVDSIVEIIEIIGNKVKVEVKEN